MLRIFATLRTFFSKGSARADARLDELCEFAPVVAAQEERVLWFVRLVQWLRQDERVALRARFLEQNLDRNPEWRAKVSASLSELVRSVELEVFLACAGIPRDFHFTGAVAAFMRRYFLPAPCRTTDGERIVTLALKEEDEHWVSDPTILGVLRDLLDEAAREQLLAATREAALDLVHQLVAQAHAPALRALSTSPRSPFRGLYDNILALEADAENEKAARALAGRTLQCNLAIEEFRKSLAERGADMNTTFLLLRMERQLERLRTLGNLLHDRSDACLADSARQLVSAATRRGDGRLLVGQSSTLVVQNLIDTTASVGHGYIEHHGSSFRAAFLAGLGGGALMAFATLFKFSLAALHAPGIWQGVVNGLNYAAIFCAAYLLHFTIATKLPAHTAAALARSIQKGAGHNKRIAQFLAAWRAAVQLQIAGVLGNLVAVAPLAAALDYAHLRILGRHVVDADKASHVLHDTSILGPSLAYAAVAGVLLWLSSLIGANVDNAVRVARVVDAVSTNVAMMRTLGSLRARAWAEPWIAKIGGLAGNASLGLALGIVPASFALFALPIDIRHVTVSAGSVAMAACTGTATTESLTLAAAGVLGIGLVNIVISFGLALWLALRSSDRADVSKLLLRLGLRRWISGHDRPPTVLPPPVRALTAP